MDAYANRPYANAPHASLLPPGEEAPLAHPFKRLLVRWLDNLLILFAMVPGFLLMLSGEDSPLFVAGILLLVTGFLGILAYQVALLSQEGQTVAKRAFKLRVVGYDDDANPGFVRAVLLREVVIGGLAFVPIIGGLLALADALFIFGAEHRCLHDHLARTRVVDESTVAVMADAALL